MEVNEDFDEELQEDEEELLVYVEFPNCNENNMFGNERLKIDIVGIDSETPIMQINGKVSVFFIHFFVFLSVTKLSFF